MHARLRTAGLVLAAVFLVACHKGGPSTGTGRHAHDPLAVLPLPELADPSLPIFVLADLDAVRASGYLDSFLARVRSEVVTDQQPGDEIFLSLLDRTSDAYVGFTDAATGNDLDLGVVVARGQYTADDTTRLEATMDAAVTHVAHGPYQLSCDADACFTFLGGHTLVVGRQALLVATLDRQLQGGGGALTRDRDLAPLLDATQAGSSDVVAGAIAHPAVIRALSSELPAGLVETMRAGAATASFQGGLTLKARVRTTSPEAAADGAARVREPIDAARRNPMMLAFGLRDVLDAVVVEAQGNDTVASISLPDARVRQLATMLEGLLQMGGG
ncbi:MAG: hypothetical protein U0230_24315 [Polyangiales bacterium]